MIEIEEILKRVIIGQAITSEGGDKGIELERGTQGTSKCSDVLRGGCLCSIFKNYLSRHTNSLF